jgi:hypothetical protein
MCYNTDTNKGNEVTIMEKEYWELREAMERAYDRWVEQETLANYIVYLSARGKYETFCVRVLEQLMEENSDVLQNLKKRG